MSDHSTSAVIQHMPESLMLNLRGEFQHIIRIRTISYGAQSYTQSYTQIHRLPFSIEKFQWSAYDEQLSLTKESLVP